jgi:hypothetical protein
VLLGTSYGFGITVLLVRHQREALGTWSFLAGVPAVLAAIPWLLDRLHDRQARPATAATVPFLGLAGAFLLLWLIGGESVLCVLVMLAPMIVFVSLVSVGVLAFQRRDVSKALRAKGLFLLLPFLPLAGAYLEARWLAAPSTAVVTRAVDVGAERDAVFAQLVEVAPLTEAELPKSWLNALGVPRPVRATVDRRATGGLRLGEFEGGLRFLERMERFEPGRRLTLAVKADTSAMRPDDPAVHAFGTPLFSVDTVEYRLEDAGPGRTRLVLSSRYTLRSAVNAYGHLWARALLASFEERLLAALRGRLERGVAPVAPSLARE